MTKNTLFKLLKLYFLIVIFLGFSLQSMADCDITINPNSPECNENPDEGEESPLDSGVVFLIIASMAFSIIAIRKSKMEAANSGNT